LTRRHSPSNPTPSHRSEFGIGRFSRELRPDSCLGHQGPGQQREKKGKIHTCQPIQFKNTTAVLALAILIILSANISFAQVNYSTFNDPGTSSTGLSGVRSAGGEDLYITGSCPCGSEGEFQGLLYKGPLSGGGLSGQWWVLNFPSSTGVTVTSTVLYGPDNLPPDNVRFVGSYTTMQTGVYNQGLLYDGPPDGSGTWQTLDFPEGDVLNTIPHSTMGGLIVGNFDTPVAIGRAFVYDIDAGSWEELIKPGLVSSITAYGIWYNGGTSYTIAGGYSGVNFSGLDQHGYLVNWDSSTRTALDWTSYDFENGHMDAIISHFNGITGDKHDGFYLTGDWVGVATGGAFLAHVRRTPGQIFSKAHWTPITYPNADFTSGDTVFENNVLGIYTNGTPTTNGFVATVLGHR
jgi:hypothetical protein